MSSLYEIAHGSFAGMLSSLSKLLDKAAEHAATQGWPAEKLLNARLADDMFPLTKQVQIACDQAKNAMARLAGKEPPHFADEEQTVADLKDRIARCLAYIEAVPASAFADADNRLIVLPLFQDYVLELTGDRLLRDWFLPHFYFHVVTAYDIMRHLGVPIGKIDYLSHVGAAIRQKGA